MKRQATFKDLKDAYKKAVKDNLESFKIEEFIFLTSYAKYLIQYLEMRHVPDDKILSSFIRRNDER